ncbi:MAG: VanW family protein [Acidimicrobiia bacterium]|nr:VanW family protein [Acidimicrobiia bacterium]
MRGTATARPGRLWLGLLIAAALLAGAPSLHGTSAAAELPPGGSFVDDNDSVHEGSIEALAAVGITQGCNPPANDRYCPGRAITRAEMAAFLARALELGETAHDPFVDTPGSVHNQAISQIAAAGITTGCNPPSNDRYCPNRPITRAEMASMLARAFDLPAPPESPFNDTAESIHGPNIDAIAASGITIGCNPPDNDRFCPGDHVTREQMASFLSRAIGLEPIEPPDAPFHLVSSFTTHHNCCETRVAYVQEVANKIDGIVLLPGDIFSMLDVLGNQVDSGNCQTTTTLFNAVWYAGLDEIEHRPHSVDFARYPQAIEATLIPGAVDMRFRNDTAHPLEIRSHYTGTSVTVELWGDNDGRSLLGDFTPTHGTVLELLAEGGADARVVQTETIASGRNYTVTRTITDSAGSESESWSWTYRY